MGHHPERAKRGLEFEKKSSILLTSIVNVEIDWFASAWDVKSLEFLDKYNLKYNKIASAMITNTDFLKEVAKKDIYIYLNWMSNRKYR